MFNPSRFWLPALLSGLLIVAGCNDHRTAVAPSALPNAVIYTLTGSNQIVPINLQTISTPGTAVAITGLGAGESMLDIDFRPANNMLYGVSSASRIYVINTTTGAATVVGTAAFSPALTAGTVVSIDFNPTVDRLRVVGSGGQNLRLNVDTGVTAANDAAINGVAGAMITDVAYINNVPTATTTVLYDIDPVTMRIYQQSPPNNGTLTAPLYDGLNFTTTNGFDVSPAGQALAGLTIGGVVELSSITLSTGRTQKLGNLPANTIGFAIPTN